MTTTVLTERRAIAQHIIGVSSEYNAWEVKGNEPAMSFTDLILDNPPT